MLVALVAGLLTGAPGASVDSATPVVTWNAPEGECPAASQVEAAILEHSPQSTLEVSAVASVTAAYDSGYTLALQVTVDGVQTTQDFTDADCSTLADATVLSVAIARDPSSVVDVGALEWETEEAVLEPEPEPAAPSEPEPAVPLEPEPAALSEPEPASPSEPAASLRRGCSAAEARNWNRGEGVPCLEFGGAAGFAFGSVPRLGFSGGGALSSLWSRFALTIRGDVTQRQRLQRDTVAVEVRAMTFGLDLMVRTRVGKSFEVGPYIGAGSTVFDARGRHFERNRDRRQAVVRLRGGTRLGASVGAFFFGVRAELTAGPAVAFRAASGLQLASTSAIGAEFAAVAAAWLGFRNRGK